MLFALFYVVAIPILVLHSRALARHNLEWLVLVLAVAVFLPLSTCNSQQPIDQRRPSRIPLRHFL